jgi:Ca-activated chloride channel family protein
MDFAWPEFLFLLGLLPCLALLLVWANSRKQDDIARLGTPSLIATLSHDLSRSRRRWKRSLLFLAIFGLVFAAARPRWGSTVRMTARQGVQAMIVLDVSASMLAEDVKPNRLTRAKLTIEELLDRLGGNELGLVLFAGAAFVQFPLTTDRHTAQSFLRAADPRSISRSGTALEQAITVALRGFPSQFASNRVILLLTDGEGHEGDPLAAAQAAAEAEVTIHAIGFGFPEGEPIPIRDEQGKLIRYKVDAEGHTVLSRLDEKILQQITNLTGGSYFRASAPGDEIETIADAINRMATGELESQFETRSVERFEWFAGLALIALTVEFLLGDRKSDHAG